LQQASAASVAEQAELVRQLDQLEIAAKELNTIQKQLKQVLDRGENMIFVYASKKDCVHKL
jgi:gamma-glutamylcyclotransferase (GGCT)/AIG2-like uncharacterized protein YtfP